MESTLSKKFTEGTQENPIFINGKHKVGKNKYRIWTNMACDEGHMSLRHFDVDIDKNDCPKCKDSTAFGCGEIPVCETIDDENEDDYAVDVICSFIMGLVAGASILTLLKKLKK